jgi:hypothetical protein
MPALPNHRPIHSFPISPPAMALVPPSPSSSPPGSGADGSGRVRPARARPPPPRPRAAPSSPVPGPICPELAESAAPSSLATRRQGVHRRPGRLLSLAHPELSHPTLAPPRGCRPRARPPQARLPRPCVATSLPAPCSPLLEFTHGGGGVDGEDACACAGGQLSPASTSP